ncbi:MAG TPA: DUF1573 domain-containing protein [Lacunisphaera sp.]
MAFAFASPGFALDWKTETLNVTTAPFQEEISAKFEFSNHGEKPVTIRDIETSCSCVRADSDRKIYNPGSSGTITAKFTVGDRGGLYERIVTVITDENAPPVRLTLSVEVPDIAAVAPRSVSWQLAADPAEKIVEVKSLEGLDIIFSKAESTSNAFSARLEAVEPGRLYRLHIKPDATNHVDSAAIRIYGREKSGHDVLLSAYASIH